MELVGALEELLWEAAVPALFGARFWARAGGRALRPMFAAFEAAFELAASPLPHALQPRFRAARHALLEALRRVKRARNSVRVRVDTRCSRASAPRAALCSRRSGK